MAWQWPAAAQQARLNEPGADSPPHTTPTTSLSAFSCQPITRPHTRAGTKSELVILAERFLDSFCSTAGSAASEFNLSEAAEQLAVSRRRLYDIVNVLEPLQVCMVAPAMGGWAVCVQWYSRCVARDTQHWRGRTCQCSSIKLHVSAFS
jgi:hypothetical protein